MKWKRWLWSGLGLVLLISLLAAVHARIGSAGWDPQLARRAGTYLRANRQALDLPDLRATLLDTAGKRVILLGEEHGLATMEELDLAMLRYLHRAAGVRVYMGEFGYAMGCVLNRYLETGDESELNFAMRETATSPAWIKERRGFYQKLREWNQTLPPGERVRFVGIDIEHQHRLALRYLDDLAWEHSKASPEIREALAKLELMSNDRVGPALAQFMKELGASLATHRQAYAALLGDRLFDFELVAENVARAVERYNPHQAPQSFANRDHAIYDNFRKLYSRMGGGVWYGRWGADHIYQQRVQNIDPFAAMLNGPESPVAGKVVSIAPLYWRAEAMGPDYQPRTFTTDRTLSLPFVEAALPEQVTLFRLDGPESPFRQDVPEFVRADLAQYVVLIRNATASHPLEP